MAPSIFSRYTEVPRNEEASEDLLKEDYVTPHLKQRSSGRSYTRPILALCCIVIIVEGILLSRVTNRLNQAIRSPNGFSLEKTETRTLYQHSKFVSKNETEASIAWGNILAGHGIVSITPQYAAERNLPHTKELPGGNGNLAYVIEAYHAIHCVARIRSHYMSLKDGHYTNWPYAHDYHCFDVLRQYIMCNADDTLLWTNGHHSTGEGQQKKCRDWDALRDWAEERSGSYLDFEDTSDTKGLEHTGKYFKGDGLPVGSF